MEAWADLHIHSIYSDGTCTPDELFQKAEDVGLAAISFTDHDSIDGCIQAHSIKSKYSVDFIEGIELSCYENGKEYHIIGYNLDVDNKELKAHLVEFRKARLKRAEKILQKLHKIDIPLNFDNILQKAGPAPVTRPHIASVMTDMGYTINQKEAFILYLGDGKPAYEAKSQFQVERAIKLINNCGGVAVLAHPARTISQEMLYKFIQMGLDGIEIVHPMHDERLQLYYHTIACQYWLLETGGSDYHGIRDYDEGNFGKYVIPYSSLESIKYHTVKGKTLI